MIEHTNKPDDTQSNIINVDFKAARDKADKEREQKIIDKILEEAKKHKW